MLSFYNSVSNKKDIFTPIDSSHVKMYVCGPTVYQRPHIGNMRSVIVYDMLYRLLKFKYPKVTYVRNITDVDDKIILESKKKSISIQELTSSVINEFHNDSATLNCLSPDVEPMACDHIEEMIAMIDKLISNGFSYAQDGYVFFDTLRYKDYGKFSNRSIDEMLSGARVEKNESKKSPTDFILWKQVEKNEFGFESKYGYGRPGWHIECSAMSSKILGDEFDIHGGGVDLKFPHHENEIAQSICASNKSFAKYWIHNGFLLINGEKMSKSLGNILNVDDIIEKYQISSDALRLALMSTHYLKPLNLTEKLLKDSQYIINKFEDTLNVGDIINYTLQKNDISDNGINAIYDDMNIQRYIAIMHHLMNDIKQDKSLENKSLSLSRFYNMGSLIGFFSNFQKDKTKSSDGKIPDDIIRLAQERAVAKNKKDFMLADNIRSKIENCGYNIKDIAGDKYIIRKD